MRYQCQSIVFKRSANSPITRRSNDNKAIVQKLNEHTPGTRAGVRLSRAYTYKRIHVLVSSSRLSAVSRWPLDEISNALIVERAYVCVYDEREQSIGQYFFFLFLKINILIIGPRTCAFVRYARVYRTSRRRHRTLSPTTDDHNIITLGQSGLTGPAIK